MFIQQSPLQQTLLPLGSRTGAPAVMASNGAAANAGEEKELDTMIRHGQILEKRINHSHNMSLLIIFINH